MSINGMVAIQQSRITETTPEPRAAMTARTPHVVIVDDDAAAYSHN
jgi:hypothetical protein